MDKDVKDYIKYLRENIKERPQCAMFAGLIWLKFNQAVPYYDNHHIIVKVNNRFYDWDGEVQNTQGYIPFYQYGDNWITNHYKAIQSKFKQ